MSSKIPVCRRLEGAGAPSRRALLQVCLRWTRGNVAEAEDLLGEASLRLVEVNQRDSVKVVNQASFLVTVINNLARDRLRRARCWKFDSYDCLEGVCERALDAEQRVLLRECLAATARKLERLNENQRSALLLRCRDVEYPRIGELLGTTEANARKLVETARGLLATWEGRPVRCRRPRSPARRRWAPNTVLSGRIKHGATTKPQGEPVPAVSLPRR